MTARLKIPSRRVIVSGATGSGKTTLLREGFAERLARVVVLDFVGYEWRDWSDALVIETCDALQQELKRAIGRPRWRLVVVTEPKTELFELLLQLLAPRPGRPSYVAGVGGLTLLCDEVDRLCGLREEREEVRGLWQRGRHVGLSILAAVQRLTLVSKTVTAQSDLFAVCRQHQPHDLEAIADYVPEHVMAVMRELPDFESVIWDTRQRTGYRLGGRPGFRVLQQFHQRSATPEVSRETAERK